MFVESLVLGIAPEINNLCSSASSMFKLYQIATGLGLDTLEHF